MARVCDCSKIESTFQTDKKQSLHGKQCEHLILQSRTKSFDIHEVVTLVSLGIAFVLLITYITYGSRISDHFILTTGEATRISRSLAYGFTLLFNLDNDPLENTDLYSNPAYSTVANSIFNNATAWLATYNDPDISSSTGKGSAANAAGGLVPWLSDGLQPRVIQQKYNYPAAPHIVFLLVDDWGYNDIGYQSTYMNWTTPHIDKLMRSGIRLTNYYSHELCGPSRAAFLTGRYATRFGFHGETVSNIDLPVAEFTIAEEMKSAGYRTNLIGKWHMGSSTWSKTPTYRGFDYFYGYYSGYVDYWTKKTGDTLDLHENENLVTAPSELSETLHSAYLYQQKAEAVIADHALNHADQPMFMYYASQLIHDPYAAPQHFVDRCTDATSTLDERNYCAMNLMLDEVVGNLTCALSAHNMFENTLVVLVSDNGGSSLMPGSSYPWRGAKGSVFRGGSSVAGFVYGSENIIPAVNRDTSYTGLVHVTDWLPTLMGLATNSAWTGSYANHVLDGVNVFNAMLGVEGAIKRREIVHYINSNGTISYQYDNYKFMTKLAKKGAQVPPRHVWAGPSSGSCAALETCALSELFSTTTRSPTVGPTVKPSTVRPSVVPSLIPTNVPSLTIKPTIKPRRLPTFIPSSAPIGPTVAPTLLPSMLPSVLPSNIPSTIAPTIKPSSLSPSRVPTTVLPSIVPTALPSTVPSRLPTSLIEPSMIPSGASSTQPSILPSVAPSIAPSVAPSMAPSVAPSVSKSISPSVPLIWSSSSPSTTPSSVVSEVPTLIPVTEYTFAPSEMPLAPSTSSTGAPSDMPSTMAEVSSSPSKIPTASPSLEPSSMQSVSHMSERPSFSPTAQSSAPSALPSTLTSDTLAPSSSLLSTSLIPSSSPTVIPESLSLSPSVKPTIAMIPTFRPNGIQNPPVDIHFNCKLYLHNVRDVILPLPAQNAVRDTVAQSMELETRCVTFSSQSLIGSTVRFVRRVSDGSYQIEVVLSTEVSTDDYATTISDDPAVLYAVLKERLTAAVTTGDFSSTLRLISLSYNDTSILNVSDITVSVEEYSIVTDDNVDDNNTSESSDILTLEVIIGILITIIVVSTIIAYWVRRNYLLSTDISSDDHKHKDRVQGVVDPHDGLDDFFLSTIAVEEIAVQHYKPITTTALTTITDENEFNEITLKSAKETGRSGRYGGRNFVL